MVIKSIIKQHRRYLVKITNRGGYWLRTTDTITQARQADKKFRKDRRYRGPAVIYKLVEVIK